MQQPNLSVCFCKTCFNDFTHNTGRVDVVTKLAMHGYKMAKHLICCHMTFQENFLKKTSCAMLFS